jgi:hypothetical protein
MPGKKYFAPVKEHEKRVHKQKLFLLYNLNEAYSLFKQCYPNAKVGISKFSEIKPRNIVTPGVCGTHSHQNIKLMLMGSKLKELTAGSCTDLTSYRDRLSCIICNPSSPECHLGYCEYCTGEQNLMQMLTDLFGLNATDEVMYRK